MIPASQDNHLVPKTTKCGDLLYTVFDLKVAPNLVTRTVLEYRKIVRILSIVFLIRTFFIYASKIEGVTVFFPLVNQTILHAWHHHCYRWTFSLFPRKKMDFKLANFQSFIINEVVKTYIHELTNKRFAFSFVNLKIFFESWICRKHLKNLNPRVNFDFWYQFRIQNFFQ